MQEKCWNVLAINSSMDTPAPSLSSWHKEFSLKKKCLWFLGQVNNCSLCRIYIWNHLGNADGTQFPWQNTACLRVFVPVQSLQMIEQWGLCNLCFLVCCFFGFLFFKWSDSGVQTELCNAWYYCWKAFKSFASNSYWWFWHHRWI